MSVAVINSIHSISATLDGTAGYYYCDNQVRNARSCREAEEAEFSF